MRRPSWPVSAWAPPSTIRCRRPSTSAGRTYGDFQERNATPVVLLSEPIAQRLHISRSGVGVFLEGHAYTVMGIYRDVGRRPEAMASVIMPYSVATNLPHAAGKPDVLIETAPGTAQLIGRQAPLALRGQRRGRAARRPHPGQPGRPHPAGPRPATLTGPQATTWRWCRAGRPDRK
ncbi:ABC transporter permease [Actinoplanes sp. NPDC026619]|uniref:ABC transporter permease n=1 Tax=Actinoplanes sp. NPDC026619 TaxID=3155798 RepID=UPI0034063928